MTIRLNQFGDDGKLPVMFFKVNHALEAVADYTKLPDGTWVVEVRALRLRATGSSPTDCKYRLLDKFDERIAGWIVAVAEGASCDKSRLTPEI